MLILTLLVGAYTVFLAAFSVYFVRLIREFPSLPRKTGIFSQEPLVSIIVPARNEEADITRCIDSLLALDYENKEIIVVDDESSDGTPLILKQYGARIRVINASGCPLGWVGKNWACHLGYQASKGDVILFTDADTVHSKNSLKSSVCHFIENRVDLLSLWPRMIIRTFWEKLIQPIVFHLFFLEFGGKKLNDPQQDKYGAFGPYLLFARRAYEAIGGHGSVKGSMEEDYRFSELIKRGGYSLKVLYGKEAVSTRMYTNLKDTMEGWVKNTYEGYNGSVVAALLDSARITVLFLLPFALLFSAVFVGVDDKAPFLILAGVCVLISYARQYLLLVLSGYDASYTILFPLGIFMAIAIMYVAIARDVAGLPRKWKGRKYDF